MSRCIIEWIFRCLLFAYSFGFLLGSSVRFRRVKIFSVKIDKVTQTKKLYDRKKNQQNVKVFSVDNGRRFSVTFFLSLSSSFISFFLLCFSSSANVVENCRLTVNKWRELALQRKMYCVTRAPNERTKEQSRCRNLIVQMISKVKYFLVKQSFSVFSTFFPYFYSYNFRLRCVSSLCAD